jgi:hypothetical protein
MDMISPNRPSAIASRSAEMPWSRAGCDRATGMREGNGEGRKPFETRPWYSLADSRSVTASS